MTDQYRLRSAATAVAAALLLNACGDPSQGSHQAGNQPPASVGIQTLAAQSVTYTTELAGRTTPLLIAEVRPQVSGLVQSRQFREGSEVTSGQVLYQIDPATYQASHDSARATLSRDQAAMAIAELKLKRYAGLHATKALSQEDYDEAMANLNQAKAVVAMDAAALKAAQIDLDRTRVTAPISGHIGRSSVTQGALVTASQANALATIQQLDPIYVDLSQSSAKLMQLQRALSQGKLKRPAADTAEVKLLLEDGTPYAHAGKLQFSEVTVDETTGTVTLRAVFPNPDQELLPGMFVRAIISEGVREQALLAPQRAVSRDAKGNPSAMVLSADNKVELRPLKLGRNIGNDWVVEEGLKAGDRLIIDGLQKIRPGASAQPAPPAGAGSASPEKH